MFKYDTVHGQFKGEVEGKADGLYVRGKKIAVFQCMKVRGGRRDFVISCHGGLRWEGAAPRSRQGWCLYLRAAARGGVGVAPVPMVRS